MKEILIAILLPNLLALPLYFLLKKHERKGRRGVPARVPGNDDDADDDIMEDDEICVFEILRRVHLDMVRQHMCGHGPWVAAALEHRCGDPAVALTAVRWTMRELLERPTDADLPGLAFRFDLDALRGAEAELEKITGAGE